jgi:hypothetical protein
MSDNPKTIQEALAEVQRNMNEAYSPPFEKDPSGGFRKKPKLDTSKPGGKIPDVKLAPEAPTTPPKSTPKPAAPKEPFFTPGKGVKSIAKNIIAPVAIGGALGAAASQGVKQLATGTQAGREFGKNLGKIPSIKSAAQAMVRGREKVADTLGDVPVVGQSLKAGYQSLYKDSKFNTTAATPADTTPKTTPADKTPTKLPDIDVKAAPKPSSKPMSFSQAFKSAREKATTAGSPSTGQFEFKGKKYQTNVAGEKYVPAAQQTSVEPKVETVPLPPKRPTDLTPKTETESGKKKKMSEDTNPLISAFLDLQSKNPSNMFEAAKKAKKDYDKDGKVESPKDEVWGSRFRAAKAAGKMEEGMIDPKDPSVQGSGDVTSTPAKKTSMPKPTAPKTDSSVQGSGDVTMNGKPARVKEEVEEVTFSQAEIDHINSFFLEASVAPNRPEVATGADSTSDKMSQNDVTGTAESGGKKIRKEETQIDEVSKELAARYRKKAHASYTYAAGKREDDRFHEKGGKDMKDVFGKPKFKDRPESEKAKDEKTIGKRLKGLTMAHKRLKEEQIDEVSKELLKRYTNKVAKGGLNKAYEKDTKIADPAKRHSLPNYNKRLEYGFKATAKIAKEETQIDEHKSMDGDSLKVGDSVGFKDGHEQYGKIHSISDQGHAKVKVWDSEAGEHYHVTKHVSRLWKEANEEVAIQEGRPRKNPTPETTERDPRKHIQVEAGRAAAGNVVDFHHNDGSKSKITPAMGRKITSHLQSLKPADRQAAVNKMHDSAEGLKV